VSGISAERSTTSKSSTVIAANDCAVIPWSAHFAVLKQADLVETTKDGKSVIYQLKLSVLEDALLGFAGLFGVGEKAAESGEAEVKS